VWVLGLTCKQRRCSKKERERTDRTVPAGEGANFRILRKQEVVPAQRHAGKEIGSGGSSTEGDGKRAHRSLTPPKHE